jgi:hypothetical protein
MLSYSGLVQPELLSVRESHDNSHCAISNEEHELLLGFNPYRLSCVKDLMQSHLILGFLKNRYLPLIEVDSYEEIANTTSTAYRLSARFHRSTETPAVMEPVLQVAISELEHLLNPIAPTLWWVHKTWSDVVLRIFDAKTYADKITSTYDLVQYLDSEESEAQSASSAGYLYGLSAVRQALATVLPEHTKYSNLELLTNLVKSIRSASENAITDQEFRFFVEDSKEFKLACDAVDEV